MAKKSKAAEIGETTAVTTAANLGSNPTVVGIYDGDERVKEIPYDIQVEVQTCLANAEASLQFKHWKALRHNVQCLKEIGANHKVPEGSALWAWIKETESNIPQDGDEEVPPVDPAT